MRTVLDAKDREHPAEDWDELTALRAQVRMLQSILLCIYFLLLLIRFISFFFFADILMLERKQREPLIPNLPSSPVWRRRSVCRLFYFKKMLVRVRVLCAHVDCHFSNHFLFRK